jgi:hypothetical protein
VFVVSEINEECGAIDRMVGNLDRIVGGRGARFAARRARIALVGLSMIFTVLFSLALSIGVGPVEATLAVTSVLPTVGS